MRSPLQAKVDRVAGDAWLGGPPDDFERVGRLQFEVLLREGLSPGSRVLDVGCGALRLGYWLLRFLDPGCYFGIEPQEEMVALGLDQLVEPEVRERSRPTFTTNEDFDFGVFGETFDFVVARSIWTHASRAQITAMIDSFARTSRPGGLFLASYWPSDLGARAGRRWPAVDVLAQRSAIGVLRPSLLERLPRGSWSKGYQGGQWVGRSKHSDEAGMVLHSFGWVQEECAARGLRVRQLSYAVANSQRWLRIERPSSRGD